MKKIVFIATFSILLFSLAIFVATSPSLPQDSGGEKEPVRVPDLFSTSTSERPEVSGRSDTFSIRTASGGTINVNKFLDDPDVFADPVNKGHYYLGNRFPDFANASTSLPPYIIDYIAPGQTFNVALLQEPITQARTQAEQYLAAKLGLSYKQLCELDYVVSVPASVNDIYTGSNLKFSFCFGATSL